MATTRGPRDQQQQQQEQQSSSSQQDLSFPGATASGPPADHSRYSALDRPILRGDDKVRVSHSCMAFLFAEMCTYCRDSPTKVKDIPEWEDRLSRMGQHVGERALEVAIAKDVTIKQRQRTLREQLEVIRSSLWYRWFGKEAKLEEFVGTDNFVIIDDDPQITKYISMPREYIDAEGIPTLNFTSFMAGVIKGVLLSCRFPAKVTVYSNPSQQSPREAQFYIEVEQSVKDRERRMRK